MTNEPEKNPSEELVDILTDPEQEIEVLDDDKVFSIPMSGAYAKRIQALGAWMTDKKKPEEILKMYEIIASEDENVKYDHFTFHFETMLILLQEIEKQARAGNCIKKVKTKDINLFSQ